MAAGRTSTRAALEAAQSRPFVELFCCSGELLARRATSDLRNAKQSASSRHATDIQRLGSAQAESVDQPPLFRPRRAAALVKACGVGCTPLPRAPWAEILFNRRCRAWRKWPILQGFPGPPIRSGWNGRTSRWGDTKRIICVKARQIGVVS